MNIDYDKTKAYYDVFPYEDVEKENEEYKALGFEPVDYIRTRIDYKTVITLVHRMIKEDVPLYLFRVSAYDEDDAVIDTVNLEEFYNDNS